MSSCEFLPQDRDYTTALDGFYLVDELVYFKQSAKAESEIRIPWSTTAGATCGPMNDLKYLIKNKL